MCVLITYINAIYMNRLSKNDIAGIISLWIDVFGDSPEFVREFLSRFASPESVVLAHNENGMVIGMAHYPVLGDSFGNHYTYLYAVAVLPEYRGKGIASKLIREVINRTKTDILATIPASITLQHWYGANFGFEFPDFPIALPADIHFDLGTGSPESDIFMVKRLHNPQ